MTKAKKEELARFFEYCYDKAELLDDIRMKNDEDIPRALTGIRAAARVGYYDVTGEWLPRKGKSQTP